MAKSTLYKISDHWYHYKDGMFVMNDIPLSDEEAKRQGARIVHGVEDLGSLEQDEDADADDQDQTQNQQKRQLMILKPVFGYQILYCNS